MQKIKSMSALFTYGTLTLPSIGQSFFGKRKAIRALLKDYKRVKISTNNELLFYPALVQCQGAQCEGLLYSDLTNLEWEKLDDYEGEFYQRIRVKVETELGTFDAFTYLWNNPEEYTLLDEAWDSQSIREEDLIRFIQNEGLILP